MKHVVDGKLYTMKDAPATTLEERIQRLEEIEAIKSIMYNYTRCTDNLDAEGIAAMFTGNGNFLQPGSWEYRTGRKGDSQSCIRSSSPERNPVRILLLTSRFGSKTNDNAVMHCYLHAWQTFEGLSEKARLLHLRPVRGRGRCGRATANGASRISRS